VPQSLVSTPKKLSGNNEAWKAFLQLTGFNFGKKAVFFFFHGVPCLKEGKGGGGREGRRIVPALVSSWTDYEVEAILR
jgi:hypothetical protein